MAEITRHVKPTYDITGLTEDEAIGIAHFIGQNHGEASTSGIFSRLATMIGWERYHKASDELTRKARGF
jgi:hypothetical protein